VSNVSDTAGLLGKAVLICSTHDKLLGDRLLRILRIGRPEPGLMPEASEVLEAALAIFSYLRAEGQLDYLLCNAQIEACIEEVVATLAARLVPHPETPTGPGSDSSDR
jgi:hypothetical protein